MPKIKLKVTDSTADGYKLTVDGRQFPNDKILRSTVTIEPWQPVTLHLDILLDELDADIQKLDTNITPLVSKEIKEKTMKAQSQDHRLSHEHVDHIIKSLQKDKAYIAGALDTDGLSMLDTEAGDVCYALTIKKLPLFRPCGPNFLSAKDKEEK